MTREQVQEFTRRATQENHSGLMLVLCDMEQVYMADAVAAYDNGSDDYAITIDKARRVLNELIDCFDRTDIQGRHMVSVLRYIYGRLVSASIKGDPCDIGQCSVLLGRLRVALEELHRVDDEGPVMKNAHQVYAGLTYGRGVLNESTLGTDYSSRGYKI